MMRLCIGSWEGWVEGHAFVMRSISAAPDLLAGLKAASVRVVPLLSCSKYLLVSSCHSTH